MNENSGVSLEDVSIQAGQVFQPRTPISTRELFAGRWDQLEAVADAVVQTGLHAVIYGERGVGKTSLANVIRPVLHAFAVPEGVRGEAESTQKTPRLVVKVNAHQKDTFADVWRRALDQITLTAERPVLGFHRSAVEQESIPLRRAWNVSEVPGIDDVRRVFSGLAGSVFIIDEFDRMDSDAVGPFTDLIKALSDYLTPVTVVIVGVADTVDDLIEGHESIGRALVQIHMPRMTHPELREILTKAEEQLPVRFQTSAAHRIVRMSLGLPHYTHLIGLSAVRKACERRSAEITPDDVTAALSSATQKAEQSLIAEFSKATRSAHRDALYADVLLACAITASTETDELGYFQASSVVQPLQMILPERRVDISTFNRHLADFCDEKRGSVLQRTGQERAYRYRFRDPLVPPYAIMKGIAANRLTIEQVESLLAPV